jgi:hypothetical protein
MWHPEAAPTAALRKAIDKRSRQFKDVLSDEKIRKEFLKGAPKNDSKVVKAFVAANASNALKTRPKVSYPASISSRLPFFHSTQWVSEPPLLTYCCGFESMIRIDFRANNDRCVMSNGARSVLLGRGVVFRIVIAPGLVFIRQSSWMITFLGNARSCFDRERSSSLLVLK